MRADTPAPTKLYLANDSPPMTLSSKKLCSLPLATFKYAATGVKRSAGISIKTGTRLGVVEAEVAGSKTFADDDVEGYVDSAGGLRVEGEYEAVLKMFWSSCRDGTGSEVCGHLVSLRALCEYDSTH